MQYNYKYRLDPPDALREELRHHVDTCRQLYNHVLYLLNESNDIPARYAVQGRLPDLKTWWDDLGDIHSKVLQMVVKRVYDNLSTLKAQKENGRTVGILKWKRPRDYRSLTYNQSGFKLKNTSGRPVLWLSKIGEIPINLHRDIPEGASIKQVTVKQGPTGEWFATFGIDVGILKYAHDTDGYAIESPDFRLQRGTRATRTGPTCPLTERTRLRELGETAEGRGRMPRRPEEKAARLPPQALELLCL